MKRIYQFLFVLAISMVMSLQANACGLEKKKYLTICALKAMLRQFIKQQ